MPCGQTWIGADFYQLGDGIGNYLPNEPNDITFIPSGRVKLIPAPVIIFKDAGFLYFFSSTSLLNFSRLFAASSSMPIHFVWVLFYTLSVL